MLKQVLVIAYFIFFQILVNTPQRTTAVHVSGAKTSIQGVADSKVIISIGERNKNLKGMMKKKNLYPNRLLHIHDRWFCGGFFVCLVLRVCEAGAARSL